MKFSRPILEKLKQNYDAHLLDQTAFQLVDDQNRHDTEEDVASERNWDPQRYRGEVAETKVTDSGLWCKFKLTDEGAELVKKNPNLGVSASIKPKWTDERGVTHDYVLRHVVGTLNPKIKGMSPWQQESITLSQTDEENEEVFDLTTVEQPTGTSTDSVTITRAEYDEMRQAIAEFNNGEELLDAILAEEDDDEVQPTNLSDTTPAKDPAITALENKVAASDWKATRNELIRDGVPASMLNLCDDVMSVADGAVINLSDGNSADPREVLLKVLNEAKGTVDLSDEHGHGKTPDEREAESKARDEYVDGFINNFNLGIF